MSFRIDDILKKGGTSTTTTSTETKLQKCCPIKSVLPETTERTVAHSDSSILHQTLLRSHPYYCRSNSEPYGGSLSLSNKYYDSYYNAVKLFYPYTQYSAFADHHLEKVSHYPICYPRTRTWPSSPYSSHPAYSLSSVLQYPFMSNRKGGQVRFTASQTDALEKRFVSHKYLSPEDRKILAKSLQLTDRQVKTWFQNRRAKWRRCNSTSTNPSDNQDDSGSEDMSEGSDQKSITVRITPEPNI